MACRECPGLGAIPLGITIGAAIINYIIVSRMSAAAAAQQVAAEYGYFRQVSDQQLTQAAFELARAFPNYKYWDWFALLERMRSYGAIPQPGEVPVLPITQLPPVQAGIGGSLGIWLLVGLGAFVAYQFV